MKGSSVAWDQGEGGSGASARSAAERSNGAAETLDGGSDSETDAPDPRLVRVRFFFSFCDVSRVHATSIMLLVRLGAATAGIHSPIVCKVG